MEQHQVVHSYYRDPREEREPLFEKMLAKSFLI